MRYYKVTYNIINNNQYLTCCRRGEYSSNRKSGNKNIEIYNINFCNFIESRKYKSVIISDVEELNK